MLWPGVADSPPRGPQNTHAGVLSTSGKETPKDRWKQRTTASKTCLPSSFPQGNPRFQVKDPDPEKEGRPWG